MVLIPRAALFSALLLLTALAGTLPARAQVTLRDRISGWNIAQDYRGGRFHRCLADTTGPGNEGLRLSFMAGLDRHLALLQPPGDGAASGPLRRIILLQPGGARFPMVFTPRHGEGLWAAAPLSNAFTDALDRAHLLLVEAPDGRELRRFTLGDTETMFAAVDGCLTQNGLH